MAANFSIVSSKMKSPKSECYMVVHNDKGRMSRLYSDGNFYYGYIDTYGIHLLSWKRKSTAEKHASRFDRDDVKALSNREVRWVNEPFYDDDKEKRLNALFSGSILDNKLRARFKNQIL